MARGRMIDRSFAKSKKLNHLPRDHRLIYATILPFLDREGRIVADPRVLWAEVFRWSDFTPEEIGTALAHLADAGLVRLYADEDNDAIIEYVRFHDFNNPNQREAKSDLPGPDDEDAQPVRSPLIHTDHDTPRAMHVQRTDTARASSVENGTEVERKRKREAHDSDTPEGRFTRLMETGTSEHAETSRVRATIRRLAGNKFTTEHEDDLTSWTRWSDADLHRLWEASNLNNWPDAKRKRRTWIYADLLNEDRTPPGDKKATHGALLRKYRGVTGEIDGTKFEVVGTDLNGELLMTDVAGYLTPQQVEEHACPN